ncbi:MAG: hypothetical protein Q8N23_27085 [Archangium sp.]|nr:hypothetical protein [Archangium sp.]MDP3156371.1 hypothetical protein [Archangium sp.]MDP3570415.1 hypothetical protein [Archangium sp.]
MAFTELSNDDLKRAQVPRADASWEEIEAFALTFGGYQRIGSRLTDLANQHGKAGTVPTDLDELRGCLFFEQRRWRHFSERPSQDAMRHIRALIEGIRVALTRMPMRR